MHSSRSSRAIVIAKGAAKVLTHSHTILVAIFQVNLDWSVPDDFHSAVDLGHLKQTVPAVCFLRLCRTLIQPVSPLGSAVLRVQTLYCNVFNKHNLTGPNLNESGVLCAWHFLSLLIVSYRGLFKERLCLGPLKKVIN